MKNFKLLTLVLSGVFVLGTSIACAEVSAHDRFEPHAKNSHVMKHKDHKHQKVQPNRFAKHPPVGHFHKGPAFRTHGFHAKKFYAPKIVIRL
jgi:hypothetical protein